MYQQVADWIDKLNLDDVPDTVAAFCFNLYDECDDEHWSMELVGADGFDADNSDWPCNEVTTFDSRGNDFHWVHECDWETALSQMVSVLREYLDKGRFASVLKNKAAVAVGFVDGDLEILFTK